MMIPSWRAAAFLGAFGVATTVTAATPDPPVAAPDPGSQLPPFAGFMLDGRAESLERLLAPPRVPATRVLILAFFATYCEPCTKGLPIIERVAEKRAHYGVRVVLLACGQGADEVFPYKTRLRLRSPIMLDKQHSICRRLGVSNRLPATYVVDGRGRVRGVFGEEGPDFEERLRAAVDATLGEKHGEHP